MAADDTRSPDAASEHVHEWQANGTVDEERMLYSPVSQLDHVVVTTTYAVQSCSCGKVRRVAVAKKDRWANRGR